jgi:hypothetical protein
MALSFGQDALAKMDSDAGVFIYDTPNAIVNIKKRKVEAFKWGRMAGMGGGSPL